MYIVQPFSTVFPIPWCSSIIHGFGCAAVTFTVRTGSGLPACGSDIMNEPSPPERRRHPDSLLSGALNRPFTSADSPAGSAISDGASNA